MSVRLLTIMGSGETAPTMVKVHRRLVEQAPGPAVLLDTPYGFQENADDITARAVEYFRRSVGVPIGVASYRDAGADAVTTATAVARLGEAGYVFAGPGSPTYALGVWAASPIPGLLAAKLAGDGAVTFASAAALTLGAFTVPVYEVYKCGQAPQWRAGLDLLRVAGRPVAVIPHFDNAEGGNHDTRFCYLGARRLGLLEEDLPEEAFVLGVDEHTGVVIDLASGGVSVVGNGAMTVRAHGHDTVFPSGSELTLADVDAVVAGRSPRRLDGAAGAGGAGDRPPDGPGPAGGTGPGHATPLMAEATRLAGDFDRSLAARDPTGAVVALLALDRALVDWAGDTTQSDEPDRVRAQLHAQVVRLGELAASGARDPRDAVAPFVEALLAERRLAREARDWAASDRLRDRLVAAGVEVRDTPTGTEWVLTGG